MCANSARRGPLLLILHLPVVPCIGHDACSALQALYFLSMASLRACAHEWLTPSYTILACSSGAQVNFKVGQLILRHHGTGLYYLVTVDATGIHR